MPWRVWRESPVVTSMFGPSVRIFFFISKPSATFLGLRGFFLTSLWPRISTKPFILFSMLLTFFLPWAVDPTLFNFFTATLAIFCLLAAILEDCFIKFSATWSDCFVLKPLENPPIVPPKPALKPTVKAFSPRDIPW